MAFACCVNVYMVRVHIRRTITLTLTLTLTLTHTITAYSVSGNVVRMRILICATRQKPCRKRVYLCLQNGNVLCNKISTANTSLIRPTVL